MPVEHRGRETAMLAGRHSHIQRRSDESFQFQQHMRVGSGEEIETVGAVFNRTSTARILESGFDAMAIELLW